MLAYSWCADFCAKSYFILAFVKSFNHFDSQPLETLERRMFLKISVYLQASIEPFTWTFVAAPASYLCENVELPKYWKNEVPHPSSPISNCPTIQTVDIFFQLVREPVCPPYLLNLFFDIFKSFIVFIILSIWWHANFADLGVRLRLSTFQIIFPRFLRTGISSDFNSIFIDWVSEKFFPGVFSPWSQKKTCKKCSPKLSPYSHSI